MIEDRTRDKESNYASGRLASPNVVQQKNKEGMCMVGNASQTFLIHSYNLNQQRFGSIPAIPAFLPNIETHYGANLCRIVRSCLISDPTQRPSIQVLWRDIQREVGTYRGLSEKPMKDMPPADDEVIRYKTDIYLQFAAPT